MSDRMTEEIETENLPEGWSALGDLLEVLKHRMSRLTQKEIEESIERSKNLSILSSEVSQRKVHPVAVPVYFFPPIPPRKRKKIWKRYRKNK